MRIAIRNLFLITSAFYLSILSAEGGRFDGRHFGKVLYIIFENTNYADAIKQPFMGQLAKSGANFTNFLATIHPSQGNYIAMVAGDNFGINHDRNITLVAPNLADLLEKQQKSWKVYAEQYPGNCYLGASRGGYARKHNPFISFSNIQTNPARCARMVNANQFDADVKTNALPDFAMYVPDIKNDGHDTGVKFADKWFAQKFGALFKDPNFLRDTLVVATFDESSSSNPNKIYTVLYGAGIIPGSVVNDRTDHYSLLRLLEENWALGSLGKKDLTASVITGIWK